MLVRGRRHGKLYVHVARFPKGQMRLYKHAARLQTVSRAVAESIVAQTPSVSERVCVIPYPVRLLRCEAKKRDPGAGGKIGLLYVGRIHPEKGIELLLRALPLLPESLAKEISVTIVGPAETGQGGGGLRLDLLRGAEGWVESLDVSNL